jgi:hypothetical protein
MGDGMTEVVGQKTEETTNYLPIIYYGTHALKKLFIPGVVGRDIGDWVLLPEILRVPLEITKK